MLRNTISSLFSLSGKVHAGGDEECGDCRQKHICRSLFISSAHYFRHESIPISRGGCVCFACLWVSPSSPLPDPNTSGKAQHTERNTWQASFHEETQM